MIAASPHPFVYLAKRSDGAWKIGFTSNPIERVKGLRSAFIGIRFKMIKFWQREDAYRVEQLARRLLRPYSDLTVDSRETFKGSRKMMISALEEAIRMADAWPAPAVEIKND